MKMLTKRNAFIAAVSAAALLTLAVCVEGEKIPPKGSAVTVSGNPVTIPLVNDPNCINALQVTSCGTSDIIATVSSDVGVPLPDQDVRFSTTAGRLFLGTLSNLTDASNIPIRTDSLGNAHVNLVTAANTTVTARSGSASGTLTLNPVPGNLSQIVLTLDPNGSCSPNSQTLTSCGQGTCLLATAQSSGGQGIQGVVILFKLTNNGTGSTSFNGNFVLQQVTTDVNGEATSKFTPDTTCPTNCGGNKPCMGDIVATTQGGALQSSPLHMTTSIP